MAECFVILGSTRSGTSVVAGILHRLGVVMGWELDNEDGSPHNPSKPRYDWPDAYEMNPDGFYQDAPLENAQDAIWGDDYPPIGTRPTLEQAKPFQDLIRMRCERGHRRWGFKASRTAWMVPELLVACTDDIRFVVTSRKQTESVESLHYWFPHYSLDICREWVRRINAQVDRVATQYPNMPHHVIDYSDLHGHPGTTISQLAQFVGVVVNDEAISFVKPELWRVKHG